MLNAQPELIADYACKVGEGPLWHPDEQRLYWVDIERGRMFRYDPSSGKHEIVYEDVPIGGATLQEDGSLLLFMANGAIKIWRDGQLQTIVDEIADERGGRFNDVIADPAGGVFCGTMPIGDRPGRLYRLDTNGELSVVFAEVGLPNGMGFTPDQRQMYHTDTPQRHIYRSDYNRDTGELTNTQTFVVMPDDLGNPDGMTVDSEGFVWSASFGGGCFVRFQPDGAEVQRIQLSANNVTSIAFGGDDYRDAYVTTAGGEDKASNGPGAGALFRFRFGIRGVPEFRSRVGLQR